MYRSILLFMFIHVHVILLNYTHTRTYIYILYYIYMIYIYMIYIYDIYIYIHMIWCVYIYIWYIYIYLWYIYTYMIYIYDIYKYSHACRLWYKIHLIKKHLSPLTCHVTRPWSFPSTTWIRPAPCWPSSAARSRSRRPWISMRNCWGGAMGSWKSWRMAKYGEIFNG